MISKSMQSTDEQLLELRSQLNGGIERIQLPAIATLIDLGPPGWQILQAFLRQSRKTSETDSTAIWIYGHIYQHLLDIDDPTVQSTLKDDFPSGVVPLHSAKEMNYRPLQHCLARKDFQTSDRLTLEILCELAGPTATQRRWLYFTEVEQLPIIDLQTLNQLWLAYSLGRFGYSVQRQLWLGSGKNWDTLWEKINWRKGKKWTRYPHEFTWDLTAPRGHLPLSNQLRGVQVMNTLLNHPAWN